MENQREWQAWWSQISVVGADNFKTRGSSRKTQQNAGRFHYPVIDIPPETICPRCDLIFNDTALLQRHLASVEYPPPECHSLVINSEPPDSASGDALWQKVRDRWRARRSEREAQAHQAAAGWKDDVTIARVQRRTPRAPTRSRTRSCTMPSSRRSAFCPNKCGKSEAQSSCAG